MTGEHVHDDNTPSDGIHRSSFDKTTSASPSYVYPVRSLFTGIHPINHDNISANSQNTRRSASIENVLDFRDVQHWSQEVTDATASQDRTGPSRDHCSGPETTCHTDNTQTSFPRLPIPTTFGKYLVEEVKTPSSLASERAHEGATVSNARRPPFLPEVAVEALATVVPSVGSQTPAMPVSTQAVSPPLLEPSHPIPEEAAAPSLPYNPSEYGLVHLPPLPTSAPRSSDRDGRSSRSSDKRNTAHSRYSRSQKTGVSRNPIEPRSRSDTSDLLSDQAQDGYDDCLGSNSPPTSESVYWSASEGRTGTSSPSQIGSSALHSDAGGPHSKPVTNLSLQTTSRLLHVQDENGNHMIVGREGTLLRCEDEPIRTPGSIQSFGVLIVVEEREDTLSVRQVSENSENLLGLSPQYLFTRECFTDTLPPSQADILWENIQFLGEPGDATDEDHSPHVFLLSGWGAPDSAPEDDKNQRRKTWTCWCAVHRPSCTTVASEGRQVIKGPGLIVMEFELEQDHINPLYPADEIADDAGRCSDSGISTTATVGSSTDGSEQTLVMGGSESGSTAGSQMCLEGAEVILQEDLTSTNPETSASSDIWAPSTEDILESTTSHSKPLLALERLRRLSRAPYGHSNLQSKLNSKRRRGNQSGGGGVGMMDVFAVMGQINDQLDAAPDLDSFLKIVVGIIKDLTQFHRVLVYQFDEAWNGKVVAELVDWSQTHDLFKGLQFPASDIPAQARELYAINKVRLLYDRSHQTARIIVRSKEDLDIPLNMTHCYLRAMSPIHIQYLTNMDVRASMSVSIMAFGTLWGLVTCHSYGTHGMRVSFPIRQMLRLLSQSISRNIERLSYAQRLHTRKLINTISSNNHPTGYIVSDTDDLLGLVDADFGILVVGEGAKILGPNQHGQEILVIAEYLRLKQFNTIQVSQSIAEDFVDLQPPNEIVAGLLYVPLSSGGNDFIAFLRKGQLKKVFWAGNPNKDGNEKPLEPRKSFKIWSETVTRRCRHWTDEHLETAGVLALVYGKFIEVWRQKEHALKKTKMTDILLSNASHEVRTPLNHIINCLEMALNSPLDLETRDNLEKSHAASKSLLFTINDLLDLTRLECGNDTAFNEPFNLRDAIKDATRLYEGEARRRNIEFKITFNAPTHVIGDARKIRTVVQNLMANSLRYTSHGTITVHCATFVEPEGLRDSKQTAVEIVVSDTGCGISADKLSIIFREFEQNELSEPKSSPAGVGLGLAVVARIVEQLGGQLRVDSNVNEGSRFSFLIPLELSTTGSTSLSPRSSNHSSLRFRSRTSSTNSSDIDSLVEALASNHMSGSISYRGSSPVGGFPKDLEGTSDVTSSKPGIFPVTDSSVPVRAIKVDDYKNLLNPHPTSHASTPKPAKAAQPKASKENDRRDVCLAKLRILIVEDNEINRKILAKRLSLDGHTVVNTTNGQEGVDMIKTDYHFDCILMDIQMPILGGFEATKLIRELEKAPCTTHSNFRLSHQLNGRIPIFVVSASLFERQHEELLQYGVDGWILKPIDHKRLTDLLAGILDVDRRRKNLYKPGYNWELGGWLLERASDK